MSTFDLNVATREVVHHARTFAGTRPSLLVNLLRRKGFGFEADGLLALVRSVQTLDVVEAREGEQA